MKVTKENCKGCPIFEDDKFQENAIKNDICNRRNLVGCLKEKGE